MRKLWFLPIIALAFLVILTTVSHNINKIHKSNAADYSKTPARIVSLAPNLTEILFALGLDEKIVAVSSDSDYPSDAAGKSKVGTFWQPSTEAIIASRPDLVITLWFEQQQAVADSLKRLGYQVLTLKIKKTEELLTAIREIGCAAGCEQHADELAENISSRLNLLKSKYSSTDKPKVLWVIQIEPLRVAGRNTFINELINLTGVENAIAPTIQQYPSIGTEEILTSGAEVIIQSAMDKNNIEQQQLAAEKFWGKFANLPAVKNNRIYVIEPDTTLRLGPRLPQGAETLARCLHPDIISKNNDTQPSR